MTATVPLAVSALHFFLLRWRGVFMDVYSRLMDIDEVIEYLNAKTDRKFDIDRVTKFIKEQNIPIVFQYEGCGTWNFRNKGEYQSLNIQLKGYFNIQYDVDAIKLFTGSLNNISLGEARIYLLDSHYINPMELERIRSNPLDGLKPKKGDHILFKNGGRASIFANQNSIEVYTNKAGIFEVDSSQNKGKVGVLKVDLEECLNNKRTETMENKIKMETSGSKIEKLESENTNLRQQLEKLAIANAKLKQQEQDINRLNGQLNSQADRPTNTNKKEGQGDSLLILGAVMHCIQDAAKKNYTQELLIQVILEKYKSVSGISEGTLKKKFPESKNYLNQKLTT